MNPQSKLMYRIIMTIGIIVIIVQSYYNYKKNTN